MSPLKKMMLHFLVAIALPGASFAEELMSAEFSVPGEALYDNVATEVAEADALVIAKFEERIRSEISLDSERLFGALVSLKSNAQSELLAYRYFGELGRSLAIATHPSKPRTSRPSPSEAETLPASIR